MYLRPSICICKCISSWASVSVTWVHRILITQTKNATKQSPGRVSQIDWYSPAGPVVQHFCSAFVSQWAAFLLKLKQFMHAIKLKAKAACSWICGMPVNLFSATACAAYRMIWAPKSPGGCEETPADGSTRWRWYMNKEISAIECEWFAVGEIGLESSAVWLVCK